MAEMTPEPAKPLPIKLPAIAHDVIIKKAPEQLTFEERMAQEEDDPDSRVVQLPSNEPKDKQPLCAEKFPAVWKQAALTRISQRRSFFLGDITDGAKGVGIHASKFKNWVLGTGKVIAEKLPASEGGAILYIPKWEENGITRVAADAHQYRSQVVEALERYQSEPVKGKRTPLTEDDLELLENAGIRVRA